MWSATRRNPAFTDFHIHTDADSTVKDFNYFDNLNRSFPYVIPEYAVSQTSPFCDCGNRADCRKVLLAQVSSRRQQQTLSRRLEDIELEESLERGRNCSSNT